MRLGAAKPVRCLRLIAGAIPRDMHRDGIVPPVNRTHTFRIAPVFILREDVLIALTRASDRGDLGGSSPASFPFLKSRSAAPVSQIDPTSVRSSLHDARV